MRGGVSSGLSFCFFDAISLMKRSDDEEEEQYDVEAYSEQKKKMIDAPYLPWSCTQRNRML